MEQDTCGNNYAESTMGTHSVTERSPEITPMKKRTSSILFIPLVS